MRTRAQLITSQCPRGHFLFWGVNESIHPGSYQCSLNALAGIFCFGESPRRTTTQTQASGSQCPRGHFLFWGFRRSTIHERYPNASQCPRGHFLFWGVVDEPAIEQFCELVSMPSRAFFVLGRSMSDCTSTRRHVGLNALAGIFCFGASVKPEEREETYKVSMPSRAFFVLG